MQCLELTQSWALINVDVTSICLRIDFVYINYYLHINFLWHINTICPKKETIKRRHLPHILHFPIDLEFLEHSPEDLDSPEVVFPLIEGAELFSLNSLTDWISASDCENRAAKIAFILLFTSDEVILWSIKSDGRLTFR